MSVLQASAQDPQLTTDMAVVLCVVLLAFFLFISERLPVDVTAIILMVTLIVLEPWTTISPADGISGFANEATITVLTMLILSTGISRTGVVQRLSHRISAFAKEDVRKQLLATVGITSGVSGFLNNTPVVALLVPVVTDVANRGNTSPSKLLIPLSYASQMGGMLTLIGTSTNILASNVSLRLSSQYPELHAFSMFEFTKLGVIVVLTGGAYLVLFGYHLLPERVPPRADYIEEYDVNSYLADLVLDQESPLVGLSVGDATERLGPNIDIVQIVRATGRSIAPTQAEHLYAGDTLVVRTNRKAVTQGTKLTGVELVGRDPLVDAMQSEERHGLVELVVALDSRLVGQELEPDRFRDEYGASVLGIRSRGERIASRIVGRRLLVGDTLLVQAAEETIDRLARNPDVIVAREPTNPSYRTDKAPIAIAILIAVVGLAALEIFPILVTALGGVVAMVVSGVLEPNELYDAVEWDIIFLLAGVIPLGIALEQTGTAAFLAFGIVEVARFLPIVVLLWLVYITTGLITEVISNSAAVVLLIPVAAAAATQLNSNPFSFVLAVTFAASTTFLGPIGYQSNLFVYGPGGYRFTDYFRIGAPLQLLLSIVTVGGIVLFWGV